MTTSLRPAVPAPFQAPPRPAPPLTAPRTPSARTDHELLNTLLNAQWGRRRQPGGPIIKTGLSTEPGVFRQQSRPRALEVSVKPSPHPSSRTDTAPILRAHESPRR
ncbi:MAG TPA: hypothetical protein VL588_05420 [Bdellovibrionota bacterium]|nr:hypothetical protein [Bdellovibrionota bacterium]